MLAEGKYLLEVNGFEVLMLYVVYCMYCMLLFFIGL